MLGLWAAIVKLVTSMTLSNNILETASNYHEATKHSYVSVRTNPHSLDFNNQPLPFKIYPGLELLRLPGEVRQTGIAALSAISASVSGSTSGSKSGSISATLDLEAVAQLLFLSAGITRQRKYSGGEIYFRAAACTGALYEIELYVVCGELDGLPAGVYHFAPAEFGLRRLRGGDYRGVLVQATGQESEIAQAPMIVVSTAIYWRNAWKYQERTYRHFGWDNGTLLANLLAVATAQGLPAQVVCGFVDSTVNRLLDIDTQREVAFSLVAIGKGTAGDNPTQASLPGLAVAHLAPLGFEVVPLSRDEIDYPLMREMHAASSLDSPQQVADWRASGESLSIATAIDDALAPASLIPLQPLSPDEMPRDPIEQVILRRGSSRQFARTAISFAQLSTMLVKATSGVPADFLKRGGIDEVTEPAPQLNDLYLIVHAVEAVEPGAYFYHRKSKALECLKRGDFRAEAGYLGLEQQLPADAAVDIFFLADLRPILNGLGNRGYRAVQMEAGVIGGKLYLAAYAQNLGASGLTFYDDEVIRFFSPHAEGKSAIFLVAAGHSIKRRP
jgi:SagB-type dehydrogenase family enzyme